MRHRSLGAGITRLSHPSAHRRNHSFSPRSDFQFNRSHASIESRRVVLDTCSGMATKNSKLRETSVQRPKIILVVEDDKHTSRLNRSILEDEGYTVACAGSGEEALKILTATTPSLILLDVLLPKMDGFTTFEKIRDRSQVPIIFVSTEDRDEDMVRGFDMGADDYIAKPFSTSELTSRVKAVLRRTGFRRPNTAEVSSTPSEPDMSFLNQPEVQANSLSDTRPSSQMRRYGKGFVSANGGSPASSIPDDGEVNYEGAVKLIVETAGEIKNLVKFVSSLRENPQFHLLRVVSNARRDGMDVWLRLRGPNPLRSTLMAGGSVSRVEASEDSDIDPESGVETPILRVSLD